MSRKAPGGVVERRSKRGITYALRFRAYGEREYVTLGGSWDGWTRERAETELANVLADVRRGIWQPPRPEPVPEPVDDPTFHEFASAWFTAKKPELRRNTVTAYTNELSGHLLPFFARHRLSQITVQEVDRYRAAKVREGELRRAAIAAGRPLLDADGRVLRPLGANTINKTLTRLGQILEDAVEYGHIDRNPAKGKRRRLKAPKNTRCHLDRADHITALLIAAGALDARTRADRRHIPRRAIIAVLVFAGLRISELCDLRWRHVDLAAGRIRVGEAKTEAGIRTVDMLPALRDELTEWRARAPRTRPSDYVFATSSGTRPMKDNLRRDVVARAIALATKTLEADALAPLPDGLTPHGLRHTYASILVALGEDPRYVMEQIGHTNPAFTLRVYAHGMRRGDDERAALFDLVGRASRAQAGTTPAIGLPMGEPARTA
jgi:integrase